LINFFLVATGGALGASLRFAFTLFSKNYIFSNHYFIITLCINILGSFLIGCVIAIMQSKNFSDELIRYFIIVGLLGSFTTFSAFSIEVVELINEKKMYLASAYIFTSFFFCISFTFLGLNISKLIS
tara:strand:+ start:77755 stop:78135 length:381 start_codon:yes stop_codon:yes gene_type:complete